MLRHFAVTALRRLRREPGYAAVNVAGLALGLAACLLLLLHVRAELRYDRHHAHADRLVRVTQPEDTRTSGRLGPALAEASPAVRAYARLVPTLGDVLIRTDDDARFYEERFYWADAAVLELFSFPFLRGDPRSALDEAGSVVLSAAAARRLFGDADPLGRTVTFDVGMRADLRVTGVMETPPRRSHFRPDFLASLETFEDFGFLDFDRWEPSFFQTYLLLTEGAEAGALEAALPAFFERATGEPRAGYRVQPVPSIHLHSRLRNELEPPGEPRYVYVFSAIALAVLLLAAVNFINLTTARAARRAREVEVRRQLGAARRALVGQFLGEAVLLAVLALVPAAMLAAAGVRAFNVYMDADLALDAGAAALLVGLALAVGLAAGAYPAGVLARRAGGADPHARAARVRRALVVAQFGVGVVLLSGVLVVRAQLAYLQAVPLGFDGERVLVVAARMYGHAETPVPFDALVQAFGAHAGVRAVAPTGDVPWQTPRAEPFRLEGQDAAADLGRTTWNLYSVDFGTLEALGVEAVEGRLLDRRFPSDAGRGFLLNRAAVRAAVEAAGPAWADPVGRALGRYASVDGDWVPVKPGRVVGVVEDFHYRSLHRQVEPLVIQVGQASRDHLLVRLRPEDVAGTVAHLERTWEALLPDRPFEAYFLDAAYDALYRSERRVAALVGGFTALAGGLACLGLFALAAYTAEQRRREVGVRKALGATTGRLAVLLAGDFLRPVLWAAALAGPVAYLAMRAWLSGFAVQMPLGPGPFVAAGGAAALVALLTVSTQAARAAAADPAEVLRHA